MQQQAARQRFLRWCCATARSGHGTAREPAAPSPLTAAIRNQPVHMHAACKPPMSGRRGPVCIASATADRERRRRRRWRRTRYTHAPGCRRYSFRASLHGHPKPAARHLPTRNCANHECSPPGYPCYSSSLHLHDQTHPQASAPRGRRPARAQTPDPGPLRPIT